MQNLRAFCLYGIVRDFSAMKMKKVLENQGLFLAEKERFELSRRFKPAYTLSRGASSANLSTSPKRYPRKLADFRTCLTIIPHFLPFVNIFFHSFLLFFLFSAPYASTPSVSALFLSFFRNTTSLLI